MVWFFLIILGMYLFERRILKNLPHYEKVGETKGRVWLKWGFGLLLVAFISTFIYLELQDIKDETTIMWFFLFFITVRWGYQAVLEWKFLESRKYVKTLMVLAVGVFAILATHFMYEQLNKTTLGEVMTSLNAEKFEITEIRLQYSGNNMEDPRHVIITDSAMMKQLTEALLDMGLQKKSSSVPTDYTMILKTDTNKSILIFFGETSLRVAGRDYVIHGPNELLDTLKNLELEWKDGI